MTAQSVSAARQPGEVSYVALGDSISVDEYAGGPGCGGPSLLVRNRDGDFPDWRGRDLSSHYPEVWWRLLATDGGTTDTVLGVQLPRLASIGVRPSLVTLTAGGNDLLAAYGDNRAAQRVVARVRRHLVEILDRVRAMCPPDAVVIVGTVYDPSDGTADAARIGLPPWPDAVAAIAELNAVIADTASNRGALVADIHGEFLGHGLSRGDPGQFHSRPADRGLWYCRVIEPNAWGASGVRAAFWRVLAETALWVRA